MLRRLFPQQFDNFYSGGSAALWLLAPIVFVNLVMSVNMMLNTQHVAVTADNIPLATYPASAAALIVKSFKSWALGHLLLTSLGALALLRYRAMVPLFYLIMIIENAGRTAMSLSNPIHTLTTFAPIGAVINLALLAALLLGFALSLLGSQRDAA